MCVCLMHGGDVGNDELDGRNGEADTEADISGCSLMRCGGGDDVCSVAAVAAHQISPLLSLSFYFFLFFPV